MAGFWQRSAVVLVIGACMHGCHALRIHSTRRDAIITAAAALPFVDKSLAWATDASAPTVAGLGLRSAVELTLKASDQGPPPVRCVQQLFQGLDAPNIYYPECAKEVR